MRYAGKKRAPFYGTVAWKRLRVAVLERDTYWCQVCKKRFANTVHHKIPITERPDLALDMDNCEAICASCHNQEHPEKAGASASAPCLPEGVRVIKLWAMARKVKPWGINTVWCAGQWPTGRLHIGQSCPDLMRRAML